MGEKRADSDHYKDDMMFEGTHFDKRFEDEVEQSRASLESLPVRSMMKLGQLKPEALANHAGTIVAKLEDSDKRMREAAVETLGKLEAATLAQHAAAIVAKLEHSARILAHSVPRAGTCTHTIDSKDPRHGLVRAGNDMTCSPIVGQDDIDGCIAAASCPTGGFNRL